MKSVVFLATFVLISVTKFINGQQNGFLYNGNCKTETPKPMQQPIFTYAINKSMQDFWNQNTKAALPNNVNQEILVQTNSLPSPVSRHPPPLPPDLQQQPLQVQQHLKLQKPLQLQAFQLKSQPDTLLSPLQSQDILQLQSAVQKQPQIQLDPPTQTSQPLQLQKISMSQEIPQSLENLQQQQALQGLQLQKLHGMQRYFPPNQLSTSESKLLVDTSHAQLINNNQPNPQIKIKWQTSNPAAAINVENPYNTQNLNIQPQHTSINPKEIIANAQKSDRPRENPSFRYYVLSQPLASPTISGAPIASNRPSVATTPTNYIKSLEELNVPLKAPYNYLPPSPPNQSANTQLPNYNQANLKENTYINNNLGLRYLEQFQLPVALQRQPNALVPSQYSVPYSIPIPAVQAPAISPQYEVSSSYPSGAIVGPAYARQKSISSNLKSIMPLLIQLLKEKLTKCGCNNDCPCECKNDRSDNKLEVAGGYTSQKDYGLIDRDALPVLDTLSEEEQGSQCLRETKECEDFTNVSLDVSDEVLDEEGSEEEEVDEDEES